jgi:cytosine deaminase
MSQLVLPTAERYWLRRATLPVSLVEGLTPPHAPEGLAEIDLLVEHGHIAAVTLPGAALSTDAASLDLDRGLVFPAFVDMHTHLDKGHIWPRKPNPDGSFMAALNAVDEDRHAHWSADDIRRRMDFSLRCAYAHGTALIRTHLDSIPPQDEITWPVFAEMRERWAGRIGLQGVSLIPIDLLCAEGLLDRLADRVADYNAVLGAVMFPVPDLDRLLDRIFCAAAERGLDVDLHVDESEDPAVDTLGHIAEAAIRNRFGGRIVCGHCCSLSLQDEGKVRRTLDRVAEAGLGVVTLPLCNMYLQDRHAGRTPRWRGVTLVHEMRARGIPVAAASDNTRDPFYAYGDLDMVEVLREATRILHLDHPFDAWPRTIAATPADLMRQPEVGRVAAGHTADLVLFRARSWTELLARPQADRVVLRAGSAIEAALPDYRELDELMV